LSERSDRAHNPKVAGSNPARDVTARFAGLYEGRIWIERKASGLEAQLTPDTLIDVQVAVPKEWYETPMPLDPYSRCQ
jgi:hypothetical protein